MDLKTMKRIRLVEVKPKNILLVLGIVLSTALSVAASLLLSALVDLLSTADEFDTQTVSYLMGLLILLIASVVASITLGTYLPLRVSLRKSMEYSRDVMDGVLGMSQRVFRGHERGYYINLVTNSAFTCGDIYGTLNVELIGNALCVALLLVVAATVSPWISLVYVIYIPLFVLVSRLPTRRIASMQREGLPTQDAFLTSTKKIVENKRPINVACAENYYAELYRRRSGAYLAFMERFRWWETVADKLPQLLSAVLTVISLAIAAWLHFSSGTTLGTVLFTYELSQLLQGPLNRCLEIVVNAQVNEAHVERIDRQEAERAEPSGYEGLWQDQGKLARIPEGTLYASDERQRVLFHCEDLAISKGSLVVIKGANGTGKSSLTDLLTGFADLGAFDGRVGLDRSLSSAAYLSRPILFVEGDVRENLFGTEPNLMAAEVLDIDFWDRDIAEDGSNLSFGEQQKLGLLRVFSQDANVIVLDEPFQNLDRTTIERLASYIAGLKGSHSVIAIMHSAELDGVADEILTIRNEGLEVSGANADALKKGGETE